MIHLDLFSGIGGFSYAADRVWDDVEHIFCENDTFCQEVIKKHWKDSQIFSDIRDVNPDTYVIGRKESNVLQQGGFSDRRSSGVFILTGGFPCQPFSQAGRRKGTADDRHLWPEMLRVIRFTKPQWIIAENVRGLLTIEGGLVFEQVCLDLEAEGYEVQPFIIPAVAVNAPHRRDRIWIVANRTGERPDTGFDNRQERPVQANEGITTESESERQGRERGIGKVSADFAWRKNWLEVATELCRVGDGLPKRLDRNPRLKALGNAVCPPLVEVILQAIKEVDERIGLAVQ